MAAGRSVPGAHSLGSPPGHGDRVKRGERHMGSSPDPRGNSRKGTRKPSEQPCWDHSKRRDGMGAAGSEEEEEEEGEEEA